MHLKGAMTESCWCVSFESLFVVCCSKVYGDIFVESRGVLLVDMKDAVNSPMALGRADSQL